MTAEIGLFALILALLLALVQAGASLYGAGRRDPALMALGRGAAALQLLFVATAFGALASAYLQNDFSIALVAQHSNTAQPALYRFGATWGSHEGSMVLWVLILAICSGGLAFFGGALRETLQARVLGVQGVIASAFLGFSLLTSNPFVRLFPAPLEGSELNPILQDPGLMFHPPILYLGYVGFSVAFSFAIAALIEGRVDAAWARWMRPWVLASWIALTVGVAGGSFWAYYTLGWGGWWFWDPVENASLMPWLMGTALLHAALALERRGALVSWTILLAILTFSMSLIGTFLVRSGILTSVHAFAVDAERGIYILAIIAVVTGSALALYAWRVPALRSGAFFAALSREAGITVNNLLLVTAAATVFLGTFYPLFVDLMNGQRISVGPPYYKLTFAPLAVILLFLVNFGQMLQWKRDSLPALVSRLKWPIVFACAILGLLLVLFSWVHVIAAFGIALGAFVVAGSVVVLIRRLPAAPFRARDVVSAARTTPRGIWGMAMAHAGLGIAAIGITAVSAFQSNVVLDMRPGQHTELAGREVTLMSVERVQGPNYDANRATFAVETWRGTRTLISERRLYPASGTQTTEAAIGMDILGNTYIALGDPDASGGLVVRLWDHPLVDWIWTGALLMALGGAVSLSDRRFRLGIPQAAALRLGNAAAT
ncbi:MAG TPA: heme lyase CcmF/NrfE family subunit [Rhizomicrobium sp.]|jgi:cytochrome c-type biogenesis protein CcmF|nr:heme lyase CcmF/NrfE family subunit [Rhizomicrobium sp.]